MSEEEAKSPTESASTGQPQSAEWVTPEGGVFDTYADWYHVNWLPLNVRIRFAQIIADPRTSPNKVSSWVLEERAALTLPWLAVKTLSQMLTNLVNAYEKENGELIIPKMPNL
jgi:hypothetical protein